MNKKLGTVIALTGIATFTIHMINRVQFSVSTVKNNLGCPNNKYYEWRLVRYDILKRGRVPLFSSSMTLQPAVQALNFPL